MDTSNEKYNELYQSTVAGPLGCIGAETTLPALSELLRTIRKKEDFWTRRRERRLSAEQKMIAAWPTFLRDMRELCGRLKRPKPDQDHYDQLAWVLFFVVEHRCELARSSVAYNAAFGFARNEDELLLWADWQCWVVAFLHQTLRDEDFEIDTVTTGGDQSGEGAGSDGDQDLTPAPQRKHTPEIDF